MAAPATSVKLFNKWSFEDVTVADLSLKDYIAVDKQASSKRFPVGSHDCIICCVAPLQCAFILHDIF
jgi:hypothetical protein